MKILKKVVSAPNKKEGFGIPFLFGKNKSIFAFFSTKIEPYIENKLVVFDLDLNIKVEHPYNSNLFHGNVIIENNLVYHNYENHEIDSLSFNGNSTLYKLPNDNYTGNIIIDSEKLIIQKSLGDNCEYELLEFKSGIRIWNKKFDRIVLYGNLFTKDYNVGLLQGAKHSEIQCFNFRTGDLLWSHEVQDWFVFNSVSGNVIKNQVRQLVIYKHLVIANMHGHLIAFDLDTGKEAWRTNIGLMYLHTQYFFILDEIEGTLWVNTSTTNYNNGTLKCINADSGIVLFSAPKTWDNNWQQIYPLAIANPNINYGDVWLPHFSMNKNFLFYSFQGGFIGVMDKKTGVIVEWFRFTKKGGFVNQGHKLLNKTLYQATEFELLAVDVSEYFIDGDEYEKNAKDD